MSLSWTRAARKAGAFEKSADHRVDAILEDAAESLRDPRILYCEFARLLIEQLKFSIIKIEKFSVHTCSQTVDYDLATFNDVSNELYRNMNRIARQIGADDKSNFELVRV